MEASARCRVPMGRGQPSCRRTLASQQIRCRSLTVMPINSAASNSPTRVLFRSTASRCARSLSGPAGSFIVARRSATGNCGAYIRRSAAARFRRNTLVPMARGFRLRSTAHWTAVANCSRRMAHSGLQSEPLPLLISPCNTPRWCHPRPSCPEWACLGLFLWDTGELEPANSSLFGCPSLWYLQTEPATRTLFDDHLGSFPSWTSGVRVPSPALDRRSASQPAGGSFLLRFLSVFSCTEALRA